MEIIKILALIMVLVLLLSSCSNSRSALEYQESSFSACLSWSVGDVCAKAIISAVLDEGKERTLTLSFSEPASLKGLVLTQYGSDLSASFGTLEIDESYAANLMQICGFFDIQGDMKKSSVKEIDSQKFNYVEILSDKSELYSIYLHPKTSLPRRICGKLENQIVILDILDFTIT